MLALFLNRLGGSARDKVYIAARLLPHFAPELPYKWTADTPRARLLRADGSIATPKDQKKMEERGESGTIDVLIGRLTLPLSDEERRGKTVADRSSATDGEHDTDGVLDRLDDALLKTVRTEREARPLRRMIHREMRGGMKGLPSADDGQGIV